MGFLNHSLLVLTREWPGILAMLGILLLGGSAIVSALKAIFKDSLTCGEYFSLGAAGALLPLFLGVWPTGLLILLGLKSGFLWIWGCIPVIAGLIAYRAGAWQTGRRIQLLDSAGLALVLIFALAVFVRLAFISGLLVPLYFDSAMHYTVIVDLIKNFEALRLPDHQSFVGGYYHLGFHVLAAAFSLALQLKVQTVILVFGQILMALLPLPLFFIIRHETKLDLPGIFAVLLAGWGWYMPAHMLDWGKYPALTSILSFEFAVCSLMLLRQSPGPRRWALAGLSALSILVSTFIHSRSLILIVMVVAADLIARGWQKLPGLLQKLVFVFLSAGLLILIYITQSKPVLQLAFDPYLNNGFWITLLVLVLLPTAVKEFSRATFSCLLFMFFLAGSMLVSVTRFLPAYGTQTLLDRPYVEGVFFIPLVFLGGLGYAGMLKLLKNSSFWNTARQNQGMALLTLCLFGTLLVSFTRYNFSPSDCCKLFDRQDAVAFEWLDKNAPPEANILVASFESIVFESDPSAGYQPAGYSGADAGIWIAPLLQRRVTLLPYQTDFSSADFWEALCAQGELYIYAGETNQSFNKEQLESKPEWYKKLLQLSGVSIYKLAGCPN